MKIDTDVSETGKLVAAFFAIGTALWAMLRFLFLPRAESWLFAVLGNEKNAARVEEFCRKPFARRDGDVIRRLFDLEEQGRLHAEKLDEVPRFSDALVAINETVAAMRDQITETGLGVARIEGFIEAAPWNGKERRQGERRADG